MEARQGFHRNVRFDRSTFGTQLRSMQSCRTNCVFFLGRIVYLVAGYFPPPSSCSSQETLANGVPGNRSIREIFIVFRVRRPVVLQRRTRPRDLWLLSINRKARRARFRCRHRRNVNINPVTRPRFVLVAVTTRDQKLMRFISNPLESFPRV